MPFPLRSSGVQVQIFTSSRMRRSLQYSVVVFIQQKEYMHLAQIHFRIMEVFLYNYV